MKYNEIIMILNVYTFLKKLIIIHSKNIHIFLLYGFLSIVMTYPLVTKLKSSIYGISHDNLGWLTGNFIQLRVWYDNLNPEKMDYLGFPAGLDITNNIYMYSHEFLNSLLLFITNHPIIAYNIYFFIKLILAGFFMFQLSYYISKNRSVAFIIGCCYSFSPYFLSMSKAYGPSFISFSLPIVILFLIKFIKEANIYRFGMLMSSFIIFLGENYYYGYFFAVSLFLTILIFSIFNLKESKYFLLHIIELIKIHRFKKHYFIYIFIVVIFLILLALHISPYFNTRVFDISSARIHSTEWQYYLHPSLTNSLNNSILFSFHNIIINFIITNYGYTHLELLYPIHEAFERTNFLGYFPIIFIILSLSIAILKNFIYLRIFKNYIIFFFILFLVSIILSFGPNYELSIPFFKIAPMFRFHSRYFIVALISWLCILTIFLNFLYLQTNIKYRTYFTLIILFVFYIDFGEVQSNNILNIYERMPGAYKFIAKDNESYAIINANATVSLPYQTNLLGFQPFHKKKMIMVPQSHFPNILNPEYQKYYTRIGVKYVVFTSNLENIKTTPLQLEHNEIKYENILEYPYKRIGYLKLFKQFDDSYIYIFDKDINYSEFEYHLGNYSYLNLPGNYRFNEAVQVCNYLNMNLVIANNLDKINLLRRFSSNFPIWLGVQKLYLSPVKENWKWSLLNEEKLDFFNWKPKEPNNFQGGEDRIVMDENGEWNDINGNSFSSAVCEKKKDYSYRSELLSTKYLFFSEKMIKVNAFKYCNNLNAKLLTIDSLFENKYITYLFDLKKPVWLNGYFDSLSNKWLLNSNNSFVNWAPHEPNNNKDNESMIIMRPDGKWNDINQNIKNSFICEF